MQAATLLVSNKNSYQSYLAAMIVLALACHFAVLISAQFTFISIHVSLFDIATGVAVGGLVVYGLKYWPAVFLGVASGLMLQEESLLLACAIASGITLEAVLAGYFLRIYLHQHYSLDYIPELLSYFLITGIVAIIVGATYISLVLMLFYNITFNDIGFIWLNASLGKVTGVAVIAPFVMVWSQKFTDTLSWKKIIELLCLYTILIVCGGIIFFGWFDSSIKGYSRYPLAYLFFPILAWAAFRFGQRVSTASTIIITTFALWSLANYLGPFSRDSIYESHFLTWLCINVASILSMILAADITQCKKVRIALQTSDERLALATSGSQDGLWDWMDVTNDKMWWSPNFHELIDYKEDEIESSHTQLTNIMHPDDREMHFKALEAHLNNNQPYNIDYRIQTKSQGYRWFHAKAEVTYDEKTTSRRMAGSIIDIDDRKIAQNEIVSLNKNLEKRVQTRTNELQEINDNLHCEIEERIKAEQEIVKLQNDLIRMSRVSTMGEMASALAHELHQPLMAIVNYSQSALLDLSESKKQNTNAIDDVKIISQQALRGGEIIRRMKEFAIRGEVSKERVDLNELIDELRPLFDIEVAENNIDLTIKLFADELIVLVNHVQMQQVVSNLVRNSIEAMKNNTGRKVLLIKLYRLNDEFAAIEIIDNGCGINSDIKNKMYDSFYTTKSTGLGLGLSISEKIVKAHHGQLTLFDNTRGATARVCLKLIHE
ncbi:MAG: MASE1 domain-containing protein [Gammaproteobacteria bacterium]